MNAFSTITFETKCYENDWEFILKGDYLKKMIERCGTEFDNRQLIINNVENRELVEKFAKKKVVDGVIDVYYFAEDFADDALKSLGLFREDFNGGGYLYSISELVGIYKCKTEYLLHFSSDAFPAKNWKKSEWIEKAIGKMQTNEKYVIANPTWNFRYKDMKKECEQFGFTGDFGISQGCSDQCYLIKISEFKKQIYKYKHPASERYPKYGGELFEKRVDSYLRCTNHFRLNYAKTSYIHANFPKKKLKRRMYFFISHTLGITFSLAGRDKHINNKYKIFVSKMKKSILNLLGRKKVQK